MGVTSLTHRHANPCRRARTEDACVLQADLWLEIEQTRTLQSFYWMSPQNFPVW